MKKGLLGGFVSYWKLGGRKNFWFSTYDVTRCVHILPRFCPEALSVENWEKLQTLHPVGEGFHVWHKHDSFFRTKTALQRSRTPRTPGDHSRIPVCTYKSLSFFLFLFWFLFGLSLSGFCGFCAGRMIGSCVVHQPCLMFTFEFKGFYDGRYLRVSKRRKWCWWTKSLMSGVCCYIGFFNCGSAYEETAFDV